MSNYGPSARYYMGLAEKARAAATPKLPPGFGSFIDSVSDMLMLEGSSASAAGTGGAASAAPTESERELARAAMSKHVLSKEYEARE